MIRRENLDLLVITGFVGTKKVKRRFLSAALSVGNQSKIVLGESLHLREAIGYQLKALAGLVVLSELEVGHRDVVVDSRAFEAVITSADEMTERRTVITASKRNRPCCPVIRLGRDRAGEYQASNQYV